MQVILAVIYGFIMIFGLHGAFPSHQMHMCTTLELNKFLLGKCLKSVDIGIVKKLRKFEDWAKITVI